MRIGGRTRVFALLGSPVSHSLSPRMHNAGFLAAGIDAVYVALPTTAEALPGLMTALVEAGGGGNVTIPHKGVAANVGAQRSARVALTASANVFVSVDGTLSLDNTDVAGIRAALASFDLSAGSNWLVLGTGGSARAAVAAAAEMHARVAVQSRDATRAAAFGRWAASIGVLPAEPSECTVVINATPLGLQDDDPLPLVVKDLRRDAVALDLVYRRRGPTKWVAELQRAGHRAIDGREMLFAQGVACWPLWFPGVAPPIDVMRAALRGELG